MENSYIARVEIKHIITPLGRHRMLAHSTLVLAQGASLHRICDSESFDFLSFTVFISHGQGRVRPDRLWLRLLIPGYDYFGSAW
jgi:hypothetical protein